MSAPFLAVGTPGRRRFLSQTLHEARPLTSCTGWAIGMLVEFGGLHITDPRAYGKRGRQLTGVAEVDAQGSSQGTTVADWQRSWAQMAPWAIIESGWYPEDVWLRSIEAGLIIAAVAVHYPDLPKRQRRWSPGFRGDHRGVVWRARQRSGRWEVQWVDPLVPRESWAGEWIAWSDLRRAMGEAVDGGMVWSATMQEGNALQSSITLVRALAPGATVAVPKGADTFVLDDATLRLVKAKPAPRVIAAPADSLVRSASLPKRAPTGPMVRVTGGVLEGRYLRATQVVITEPPQVPAAEAEIAAAYDRGRADERALYEPIDEAVFTRAAA